MTAAATDAPSRRLSTGTRWEQLRRSYLLRDLNRLLRDLLRDLLRESVFWTAPYSGLPLSGRTSEAAPRGPVRRNGCRAAESSRVREE